ncbi:ESX-1 secretion-associated protein [Mycobacterium camsae]|uniref:ESX-1 secretion-associated protein n=1 Tax=Mycobacterium gordonae TaxID=1778 RepID=UPI001980FB2F|nr:ESX-1 secretion-associated protein [Mycobacterium gordonae]
MPDLTVTAGYLEQLAAMQDQAATAAGSAADAASGIKTEVWVTHGVICGASNIAFTGAEEVRRAAGEAMKQASINLAAKLRAAESGYHGTDEQTRASIDQQVVSS